MSKLIGSCHWGKIGFVEGRKAGGGAGSSSSGHPGEGEVKQGGLDVCSP